MSCKHLKRTWASFHGQAEPVQWPCTWLAPLSWAEQAGPPWSQATSTGRLCARNSTRVFRRCNTTFHWGAICVCSMFFPDFQLAESIHPLQSEPGLRILGCVETRTTLRDNSRNSSSNNNLKKQNSKQRRQQRQQRQQGQDRSTQT